MYAVTGASLTQAGKFGEYFLDLVLFFLQTQCTFLLLTASRLRCLAWSRDVFG